MNPFGDDSDEDAEEFTNPFVTSSNMKSASSNRFENHDEYNWNAAVPAITAASDSLSSKSSRLKFSNHVPSSNTNPFQDDDDYDEKERQVKEQQQEEKVVQELPLPIPQPLVTNPSNKNNRISKSIDFADFESQNQLNSNMNMKSSKFHPTSLPSAATTAVKTLFRRAAGVGSTSTTTTTSAAAAAAASSQNNTHPSTTSSTTHAVMETLPIASLMDQDIITEDHPSQRILHSSKPTTVTMNYNTNMKKNNQFNFLQHRKNEWFGKNVVGDDDHPSSSMRMTDSGMSHSRLPSQKRNVFVQCWPYDDYHKEQERYYKSLQEENKVLSGNNDEDGYMEGCIPTRKWAEETDYEYHSSDSERDGVLFHNKNNHMKKKKNSNVGNKGKKTSKKFFSSTTNSTMHNNRRMFERPADLPAIKEAVHNLNLQDFDSKAQERAISIVSTWLFDEGLIDELLVSGVHGFKYTGSNPIGSGSSVANQSISISSVRSSEGIEVGVFGYPIEGGMKIDKEIEKMKVSRSRELTMINTKLNDGVVASGMEVQELVNAVTQTKEDLGRLRELAAYISRGYKNDLKIHSNDREPLNLSDYPRLKRVINAKNNIFRVFRELDFFSQIPVTCDRLRDELHSGEWSENEWNTIRDVCMEHVELEILLVEAEAGMKAWLDDDVEPDDESSMPSIRSTMSLKRSWKGRQNAVLSGSDQVVDDFLAQHVKNVWELGEEIRMRILSGIGSAFDLALRNPAGMVALVEAVEVYERAAEQYKNDSQNKNGREFRLNFTNMRSAALAQLYEDFEIRGLELFRAIHMQAADMAEEDDATNSQFTAVLRAATELVAEIDVVKNQMAPCFAPHWHVEMLWSSCVAHVCSNQIIQQIGGPDGQHLPDLSVTQLLDLVAWVEFFRQTIEEAFPQIGSMHAKKTYFEERPDIFSGSERSVNMDNATDSLAWVNNMLWEVHRLAQDEFLHRTRSQTDDLISKVYKRQHETTQTSEGRLFTSLCEDVFQLIGVQLRTIRERLTPKSDALVMTVCLVFSQLRTKQLTSRDVFLQSLESCCAAANDFQRMSEQVEDVVNDLIENSDLSEGSVKLVEESCAALVSVYSGDAVYAAQKVHSFVFEPLWESISGELFSAAWENEYTHNELALRITHTLDDFMRDLENFLDEFMLKKTVDSLVAATVVFYIKSLLLTAEKHTSNKNPFFMDNLTAIERMDKDIKILRQYFVGLAEGMPALNKVVEKEFDIMTTVEEILRIAAGQSESNVEDFIVPLHKRLKNVQITQQVVGDLWHLVQPSEERAVWELIDSLELTLLTVCPPQPVYAARDRMNISGLRFDESIAELYLESKRKRPVNAGVMEKMATMRKSRTE